MRDPARSRRADGRDVARRRRSGGLSVRRVDEPRAARSRPALARSRHHGPRAPARVGRRRVGRGAGSPGDEAGFVALADGAPGPGRPGLGHRRLAPVRGCARAARSSGRTARSPCGGRSSGSSEPARSRSCDSIRTRAATISSSPRTASRSRSRSTACPPARAAEKLLPGSPPNARAGAYSAAAHRLDGDLWELLVLPL